MSPQRYKYLMSCKVIAVVLLVCLSAVLAEKDYTSDVRRMKELMQTDKYKYASFERLAYLSDTYGPRMWGTPALEQALFQVASMAQKVGFDNVHLQEIANFTAWKRGKEYLILFDPRPFPQRLGMIGLGNSVAGYRKVKAEVIVFRNWTQMEARKDEIRGKIVCFNNPWVEYYDSVVYREDGPSKVAAYGAVAALARSQAREADTIYSVHAGVVVYNQSQPKIPAASITIEDSEMFQRMQDRGQKIVVELSMENKFEEGCYSNNVVFEIRGSTWPDQIVVAGGHMDSWDTGSQSGADDDGGGVITIFEALKLLKENGWIPRRTIRFVGFSGEEQASLFDGAHQYPKTHKNQIDRHVAAFESDYGSYNLLGIGHSGGGKDIVIEVLNKYMSILNASYYEPEGFSFDVNPLYELGVPMFKNSIEDSWDHARYIRTHHTAGDTMSIMDKDGMDSNVVGIAAFLYIIADLEKTVRDVPPTRKFTQ